MTVARLEARGVSASFAPAGRPVLSGVSLSLLPGEVHALVGPNGAGKSTLFGVLSGDIEPESGAVTLDGQPLHRFSARELARTRGVLLQHNSVAFSFTGEQVVRMGRAPWARTQRERDDDRVVTQAMRSAEVLEFADRSVSRLSGGERARVGLARVLAQDVDVLLLDEPTASLDLKHHEDVMSLARGLARAGAAIAIVLHDLNAAITHADRVTLLDQGRVAASGSPREVLTAPLIEDVYGQPVDVIEHPRTGAPVIVASPR